MQNISRYKQRNNAHIRKLRQQEYRRHRKKPQGNTVVKHGGKNFATGTDHIADLLNGVNIRSEVLLWNDLQKSVYGFLLCPVELLGRRMRLRKRLFPAFS